MQCPQCGATMAPVTHGDYRDKFMRCDHCGFQTDVPDSYSVEETEEFEPYVDEQGRTVRRRVTRRVTRSDGPLRSGSRHVDPGDDFEQIIEEMRSHAGDDIAEVMAQALQDAPDAMHDFEFQMQESRVEVTDTQRSYSPAQTTTGGSEGATTAMLLVGGLMVLACVAILVLAFIGNTLP